MATSNERKALWFFAFVALSGAGVRLWKARAPEPAPQSVAALEGQLRRVDSARAARVSRTRPRGRAADRAPAKPSFPIDIDRATATELDALPGIGPALAGRIVANRDSAGAFGRIEAICQVRGIGPVLMKRLRPLVTFSGPPRPLSDACNGGSRPSQSSRSSGSRKPS